MEVKILGTGCPVCRRLEQVVREIAAAEGIEIQLVKVTDIDEIMAYDILATPGLVIAGRLRSAGRLPRRDEIVAWLKEAR